MKKTEKAHVRGPGAGKDWTKGSIARNLVMLSWPIIVSQSLNMVGPTIDMIWVGKLGKAAIAGVGVAGMAVMFGMAAMMGLAQGARAIIARFIGRGDPEGANHVARQAFLISACYALVMVSVGIYFTETILTLMKVEADVVAEGSTYMRIMFLGGAAMAFRMMTEGVMQSSGDAKTPMKISLLFRAVHLVFCPLLVFGVGVFPRLGVSGAAVANLFSQGLGLAVGLWILFSGRTLLKLTLKNFYVDLGIMWRIVKIGIPAIIMGMQRGFGHLILMYFMVPFGTTAVAAHTILQRVEMILVMVCMGAGISAGVLAGQNLGAGYPERAEKGGWLAAGFAESIMILCAVGILLWPDGIIRVFNTDPELISTGRAFLRINVFGFLLFGFVPMFMQVLSGVGDTLPPMLFEVIPMWGVLVPLAIFLPKITGLGVYGIRWAIVASMVVSAIAYVTYFRLGRWKKKMV